jgi:hypothetical protein
MKKNAKARRREEMQNPWILFSSVSSSTAFAVIKDFALSGASPSELKLQANALGPGSCPINAPV